MRPLEAAAVLERAVEGQPDDAVLTAGTLREAARRLREGDDEGRLPGEPGYREPWPVTI